MIRVATTVAALIVLLLAAAAPTAARDRCAASARHGSKVVVRTAEGVVFTRGEAAYGCLYSRNATRRLPLGSLDEAARVEPRPVGLAGRFVAYTVRTRIDVYDDPRRNILVFDLASAEIALDEPVARGSAKAADIALKRNGSVAWSASWCGSPCKSMGSYGTEVRRWEGGAIDTLDSWTRDEEGPTIHLKSLELAADRRSVSWETSTGVRRAKLR